MLRHASWQVHAIRDAPPYAARLHAKLCALGCAGPYCDAYLHKLLLHLYLAPLRRVIFLDSDVRVMSDIDSLWRAFDDFGGEELIGLANESNAFLSQEPVVARGGISSNGGVVLLQLAGMRRRGFTDVLWRYARRDASLPLNAGRGVGWAAEQVRRLLVDVD